jgi:glyoxylase-like metal-dependent hydrolase (beta-lactamase superfamily II)
VRELAPGLWRWTARHAEWHPGVFGAEVASFAVEAEPTLLIDPLLPADGDGPLERLDALEPKAILITIPYHARSAEELSERYGAPIHGHPAVAKRLERTRRLKPIDGELPGGARAYPIGKPRRYETPIHLPSHKALAWGDAIVATPAGDLRLWHQDGVDEKRIRWYRERFNPTLAPLLELDLERILVTHGEPVLEGGSAALRRALDEPPWYLHN